MPVTKRWTAEEVRALLESASHTPRYELVDGELLVSFAEEEPGVTNAPSVEHQRAVRELLHALGEYLRVERWGEALSAPADIELEPGSIVQPDVFVVPSADGARPRSWSAVTSLLLAVEVLSPSTARHDRIRKRRFFRRLGVPEYWVVDTDVRVVERSHPGDERVELLDECVVWHPAGAAEPFVLELGPFFTRVHGEPGA